MGQKVHPEGFRVGYIHDWKSNWFNEREFADYLLEDMAIRDHIEQKLAHAGLSDITIMKQRGEVTVDIHTARPGIVIGKSGAEVDALRRDLHRITRKPVRVNIREIKRPELDAKLVAQSIAEQLQNRVAFRRAMKRALTSAMRSGAKGVKVQVSGRLGGAEMARTEGYSDGRVPLHTLRADIDYGFTEARTTTGRIGVKCWINKGEVMPEGYGPQLGPDGQELGARPARARAAAQRDAQDRAPEQRKSGGESRDRRARRGPTAASTPPATGQPAAPATPSGEGPAPASPAPATEQSDDAVQASPPAAEETERGPADKVDSERVADPGQAERSEQPDSQQPGKEGETPKEGEG